MSDTVVITTSIITEIGSSRMPRSMCNVCVKRSQTVSNGTTAGNTPPVRGCVKYSQAAV